MTWLSLSLLALAGFGLQNFVYKVAAERRLNSRVITFYFVLLSTTVLWVALLLNGSAFKLTGILIALACCDAIAFYLTTLTRLEALRYIPTHLAFPLLRTSTVLVALCGLFFFGEAFTTKIGLGLILMLVAAWLISTERKQDRAISINYRKGLLLSFIAVVFSAATNVVSKLAADHTQLLDYMALANTLIILLSFVETRILTGTLVRLPTREELHISAWLAGSNLLAWYCYLLALRSGPLNVTAIITGMGFVVPIVLAAIVYRETLTPKRILAIVCTAGTVLLLK